MMARCLSLLRAAVPRARRAAQVVVLDELLSVCPDRSRSATHHERSVNRGWVAVEQGDVTSARESLMRAADGGQRMGDQARVL